MSIWFPLQHFDYLHIRLARAALLNEHFAQQNPGALIYDSKGGFVLSESRRTGPDLNMKTLVSKQQWNTSRRSKQDHLRANDGDYVLPSFYDDPNSALRDPIIYLCNVNRQHRTGTGWQVY
ncbi:hypothetical protein F4802DRAFT_611545 [Xylaria palmicola]|nr:hypothetical protein F4802DRAFT_611545 [Xylaria palmicola]